VGSNRAVRRLGDTGKAGTTALVLLCVAVATLGIVTAAAQGAVRHLPEPAPSKAISEGLIGLPNAMTVDSGHLWVAADERNAERKIHDRIQEFNASTGALTATFPQISGFENERSHGLAVGHGTGEELIYATDQDDEIVPEDNVLAAFDEAGNLKATWTGAKTPMKAFGHDAPYGFGVSGVAVDESIALGDWASGDVYVADGNEGAVDLIKPAADGEEGELIAQLTGPKPGVKFDFNQTISGGDYVAVDEGNGDVAVIDERTRVYVFEPESGVTGSYRLRFEITGTPAGPFTANRVNSVAFDAANGEIFVSENETGSPAVYEFDSAGAFIGKLTGLASGLTSVAVDSEAPGDAYVGGGDEESPNMLVYGPDIVVPNVAVTEPPLKLTPTGVTLRGTVNPNEAGEASCEFEYGTSTEYGHRTKCRSSVPNGDAPVAVESEPITGLAPDTTYHYRLDAMNANKSTNTGEGVEDLGEVHTLGAAIDQQDSAQVGAEAATLEARIDPNGSPTTYYFQYGTSNAYGSESPAAPGSLVGSGHGDVEVGQSVKGLQPNTLYHYRVVTVSELSLEVAPGSFQTQIQSVYGPDRTFTTTLLEQPFELPDHRQWEMVTPPQSEGALFYPLDPFKNPTLGIAYLGLIQAAADGEAIVDLASRPTEPQPEGYANLVPVLSTRTSGGWVSTVVAPPHAEATSTSAGEGNEYRFFSPDLSEGVVQQFGNGYALSPEATEETPYIHLDYLPGHAGEFCAGSSCYEPLLTAANTPEGAKFGDQGADQTNEHECDLLCGPQFVDATPDLSNIIIESDVPLTAVAGGDELYDWSSGQLQPLYVLPAGEGGGVAQPGPLLSATNNQLAPDGRLFFSYDGHLYVQDLDKQATFRLDVAQGVPEPASAGAEFLYASADGSTVFFSDAQQLTSAAGGGIYACRIVEEAGSLHCQLSLLSDPGADQVVGTSEDGSYVYVAGAGGVDVAHYDDGGWEARSTGIPSVAAPREGSSTRVSANGLWLALTPATRSTMNPTKRSICTAPRRTSCIASPAIPLGSARRGCVRARCPCGMSGAKWGATVEPSCRSTSRVF
jgi:hypothetical protein